MSDIEWQDRNFPVSHRFDDPYYSRADGQKETEYVFINGNRLLERWPQKEHWTIGELGFGTGLNFLETLRHWKRMRRPDQTLDFVSFEQYPLSTEEIHKALSNWPSLISDAKMLEDNWQPDKNTCQFKFDTNTHLTVYIGDANVVLPQLDLTADAWYLDGFSPAKNPQLWGEELMSLVANKTKPGGTFATYTAAGYVRRNLQAAGFKVEKTKGFGRKRDMLIGTRQSL